MHISKKEILTMEAKLYKNNVTCNISAQKFFDKKFALSLKIGFCSTFVEHSSGTRRNSSLITSKIRHTTFLAHLFFRDIKNAPYHGMKVIAKIPVFALFMLCAVFCNAQHISYPDSVSRAGVTLYFRHGESRIDPSYRGNGERMAEFERMVSELNADTTGRLRSVTVTGADSPEGTSTLSVELSDARAAAMKEYVASLMPQSRRKIKSVSLGIDWERMKALVLDSDIPRRHAAADIIEHTPVWVVKDGKVVDGRKHRLTVLDGGAQWRQMTQSVFPELRRSSAEVRFETVRAPKPAVPDTVIVTDTVTIVLHDTIAAPAPAVPLPDTVTAVSRRGGYPLGIGTNLLFDALFIPNLSLEFPLGAGWSAGANWMYGWTERNARRLVYAYGGELHIRYWTPQQPRPLAGHHFGIYAQMLRFNVKQSQRGYLSDRWSYGAGFEYGYSIPLGSRLRLDLTVGMGYLTGTYREYTRQDGCDVWQATKRLQWAGPAKAEISVIWVIGRAKKKGGGR